MSSMRRAFFASVHSGSSPPFRAFGGGTTHATGCPFNSNTEPLGSTASPSTNCFTASFWASRLTCVMVDSNRGSLRRRTVVQLYTMIWPGGASKLSSRGERGGEKGDVAALSKTWRAGGVSPLRECSTPGADAPRSPGQRGLATEQVVAQILGTAILYDW